MHEIEMKLRDICEMRERLTSLAKDDLCGDLADVNVDELSAAVDMVKDLAEAEEKLWKACYYKTVIKAMEGEGLYGYDNWRTSSGRFANKGAGHYAGYPMPMTHQEGMEPYMGYSDMPKTTMKTAANMRSRYGYPYEEWQEARKRNDRMGMNTHAEEHVKGMVESIRDIWNEADPVEREKLKHEMAGLAEEMDL